MKILYLALYELTLACGFIPISLTKKDRTSFDSSSPNLVMPTSCLIVFNISAITYSEIELSLYLLLTIRGFVVYSLKNRYFLYTRLEPYISNELPTSKNSFFVSSFNSILFVYTFYSTVINFLYSSRLDSSFLNLTSDLFPI